MKSNKELRKEIESLSNRKSISHNESEEEHYLIGQLKGRQEALKEVERWIEIIEGDYNNTPSSHYPLLKQKIKELEE